MALACVLFASFSCGGGGALGGMSTGSAGIAADRQFDGDTGTGAYKDHPDMTIGSNGTQVVESTGQNINVYNYSGAVLTSSSISAFIRNATGTVGTVNDPRIVYDPFISRWLFVCSCSANYLIVSASSDASGGWKGLPLSGASGDLSMAVGFDKNGVYVAETDSTLNGTFFAIPNADVAWSGSGTISLSHEGIASGQAFAIPAIDLDPNKAATSAEYFVAHSVPLPNGTNVALSLEIASVNWSGLPSTPVAAFSSTVAVATGFLYNTPKAAPQPSPPDISATESRRVFSAYSRGNGHLYSIMGSGPCSTNCGSQGADSHDLFFFFDLSVPGLTLNQAVKVASSQNDLLFPSLAVDSVGNIAMAATGVSATQNPSVYEWHQLVTDSAGTIHGPNLITGGTSSYSCASAPVGWGTYSATTQDGGDPTRLWTVQEYGNSPTACRWYTRLIEFHITG
jgi:hypothetical protein